MGNDNQIDIVSKLLCNLKASEKKYAKREHKRRMRRISKNINNPNPQYNRYCGYIG
jgi:hypothetical protein